MNSSSRARVGGSASPFSKDSMPSSRWNFDATTGWTGMQAESPTGGLGHTRMPLSGTPASAHRGGSGVADRPASAQPTRDGPGGGAHGRAQQPGLGVLLRDDDGERGGDPVVGTEDGGGHADQWLRGA